MIKIYFFITYIIIVEKCLRDNLKQKVGQFEINGTQMRAFSFLAKKA